MLAETDIHLSILSLKAALAQRQKSWLIIVRLRVENQQAATQYMEKRG
jgi:hypothetical protein